MKKLIILIIVAGGAYHFWNKYDGGKNLFSGKNTNGFVVATMPDGTVGNTVYILAPQNCPKEAGVRADAIERALLSQGVPTERKSSVSVNAKDMSDEEVKRFRKAESVLKGEIPAIFVNGMASSNPQIKDIVAEYRRTRQMNGSK